MGLMEDQIFEILLGLAPTDFDKSMTAHADHRLWQDVYHAAWGETVLYIKFQTDRDGFLLLSFKEK